jgi:hypothetical protein
MTLEATMTAHRIEATLGADKTLTLDNLPFPAGTNVEVIVMERRQAPRPGVDNPLRGCILRYDDPTEPVAVDDWEVLQ